MDNSQSVWRSRARYVAIGELALLYFDTSLLGIFILLVLTRVNAVTDITVDTDGALSDLWRESQVKNENAVEAAATKALTVWFSTVGTALTIFVRMWAIAKLFNASQIGKDINEAVAKAIFYRNIIIVLFVLSIAEFLFLNFWEGLSMIWRGGCTFVVILYIKELQRLILSAGYNADPTFNIDSVNNFDPINSADSISKADSTNNADPTNNDEPINNVHVTNSNAEQVRTVINTVSLWHFV